MAERFRIETGNGFPLDRVKVRVIAKAGGWGSPDVSTTISGDLSVDEAREFANALLAQADVVAAKNAKRDAQDQRRRARSAKLPQVSFR